MDTTKNISLGGFAFTIDETAYQLLSNYLQKVKMYLKHSEDVNEIIYDVEQRLAELLKKELNNRDVINTQDVERIMEIMGKPEQFRDDDDEETKFSDTENLSEKITQKGRKIKDFFKNKKLYRDGFRKKIGGVLAGFSRFLDVDVTWTRILLLVFIFVDLTVFRSSLFTLPIVIFYIICWIVVPEAQTTTDRLKMEGKSVNIDTIAEDYNEQRSDYQKKSNFFDGLFHFIGEAIKILAKIILFFILGIAITVLIAIVLGLILSLFGIGLAGWGLSVAGVASFDFIRYLVGNGWLVSIGITSLFAVLSIPLVGLILLIIRLVNSSLSVSSRVVWAIVGLFVMGLIGLTLVVGLTVRDFSSHQVVNETITLHPTSDTITLGKRYKEQYNRHQFMFDKEDNLLIPNDFFDNNIVSLRPSDDNSVSLEIKKKGRGKNLKEAEENIQNVDFNYEYSDDKIITDWHNTIKKGSKWRNQQIELILNIPNNSYVRVTSTQPIRLYTEKSIHWKMSHWHQSNLYRFEDGKLICVSCPEEDIEE